MAAYAGRGHVTGSTRESADPDDPEAEEGTSL